MGLYSSLLKHSADVNRKDKHNRTSLLCACTPDVRILQKSSRAATAELLMNEQIKRSALFSEINVCSKSGRTPLREAAGRGFVQVVTAILKQMGPEDREWTNKRDERRGRSPLHSAATHGRGEVIVVLLRHGADPNLRDGKINEGKTCLELCLDQWANTGSKRYEDAIALLIDACAEEVKKSKLDSSLRSLATTKPWNSFRLRWQARHCGLPSGCSLKTLSIRRYKMTVDE